MIIINIFNFLTSNPCYDPEILKVILYIRKLMNAAFIIVPIVLIILITFDFVKSVTASSEDVQKKNVKIVIKRIVYCILLFFVMPIVNIVFGAFSDSGNNGLVTGPGGVNYFTCWDNAESKEKIEKFVIEANFNTNVGAVYGGKKKTCGGIDSCQIFTPNATSSSQKFLYWQKDGTNEKYASGIRITIKNGDSFTAVWGTKESDVSDNVIKESEEETKPSSIVNSGNFTSPFYTTYKVNNSTYYILANVTQIRDYLLKNGPLQKNGYNDKCLGIAYVYSASIYKNNIKYLKNFNGTNGPNTDGVSFIQNNYGTKDELLRAVYKEFLNKKPTIVHINGNAQGTSRHYSPVVGFKTTADPNNLKESDMLLMDVWEADLEQMNGKGNPNGVGMNSRFLITGKATGREYGYQTYTIK